MKITRRLNKLVVKAGSDEDSVEPTRLRRLGKKCLHQGYCCDEQNMQCQPNTDRCKLLDAAQACTLDNGPREDCGDLVLKTPYQNTYTLWQHTGSQPIYANMWDFFEPRDMVLCPLLDCIAVKTSGASHEACMSTALTFAPNGGSYSFDTNGCALGTSTWKFGCRYDWPEGGVPYTYTPGMSITVALQPCLGVQFTPLAHSLISVRQFSISGSNLNTLNKNVASFIQRSETAVCKLQSCRLVSAVCGAGTCGQATAPAFFTLV